MHARGGAAGAANYNHLENCSRQSIEIADGRRLQLVLPRTQGLEKRRRVSKRTSLYTRSISHAVRVEEPPHLRPPLLYLLDR